MNTVRNLALAVLCFLFGACQKDAPDDLPAAASANPESPRIRWDPNAPTLTDEEAAAYGDRAAFFENIRPENRPDLRWREALSGPIASENAQWSQGFEELVIRDFFQDKRDGFFLDVGCYLPREMSTTYYLEDRLGWTGIGVDAIAEYEKQWKEHRPNATFVARAVSDKDGDTITLHVAGPIASIEEGVVEQFAGKSKPREVETITLTTLLEEHGIEKIDFLSMDIEGAEPAALRGFDIQRFKPELCCVESLENDFLNEYFSSNGYELIEKYQRVDKLNSYYRRSSN